MCLGSAKVLAAGILGKQPKISVDGLSLARYMVELNKVIKF